MSWAIAAGLLAGFVLGYLGAGGTVVGIPIALYLAGMQAHVALGSNALGVSLVALGLLAWRIWHRQVPLQDGLLFTLPGLAGIYLGARLGLIFPGQRLVFLLGFLLFIVAGWLFYLSARGETSGAAGGERRSQEGGARRVDRRRAWAIAVTALAVGGVAGFFAIGGGFMIVPALSLVGGLDLVEAAAAGLLPISTFAGWIGVQYWAAGQANLAFAGLMFAPGMLAGLVGIRLAQRVSRRVTQRAFAAFLVLLGLYMIAK